MIQHYLQQVKSVSKISLKDIQKQILLRQKNIQIRIQDSNNRAFQIPQQYNGDLSVTSPYYFRKQRCVKEVCKCPFHGPRLKPILQIHKRLKTQGQIFDQSSINPKNFPKDLSNVRNNQSEGAQCEESQLKQFSKIKSIDCHRQKYLANFKEQHLGKKISKQVKTKRLPDLDCYNQEYERFLKDNILVILEDLNNTDLKTNLQKKAMYGKQKNIRKNISFSPNGFQGKYNELKAINENVAKAYSQNKVKRGHQRTRTQQSLTINSDYQPNSNVLLQNYISHQASLLLSMILSSECQIISKDTIDQLLDLSDQQYQAIIRQIVIQIGQRKQKNCLHQNQVQEIIDKKLREIQNRIKMRNDPKDKVKLAILHDLIGQLKKLTQGTGQQIKLETIKSLRHISRILTKKSSILQTGTQAAQNNAQKGLLNSFEVNMIQQLQQGANKQTEKSIVFPRTGSVTVLEDNNFYLNKGKNPQKPDRQQHARNRFNRKFITDKSHNKSSTSRRKGISNVKGSILMMLKQQHQAEESIEVSEAPSETEELGKEPVIRLNHRTRQSKDKKNAWLKMTTQNNMQDQRDQSNRRKIAKPHTTIYMELDKCKTALHHFRHLVKRVQAQLQKYDLGEVIISTEKDSILTKKRKIRVIRKVMENLRATEGIQDFSKYIQIYQIFCYNCVKAIQSNKSQLRALLRKPDEDCTEQFQNLAREKDLKFMRLELTQQKIQKEQLELCLEMKTQSVGYIKRTQVISSKNIQQVQTPDKTFISRLQRQLHWQPQNDSNKLCQIGLSNCSILSNITHLTQKLLGEENYPTDSEEKSGFRRYYTEASDAQPIKHFGEVNTLNDMSAHRLSDKVSDMYTFLKKHHTKTQLIRNEKEVKKIFHYLLTRYPSCGKILNNLSNPGILPFLRQSSEHS